MQTSNKEDIDYDWKDDINPIDDCKDCGEEIPRIETYQYAEKCNWFWRIVFGQKYKIYKPLCKKCYERRK